MSKKPEILAPAGDLGSFFAALAGGADAVYVGLKHFSARMEADNFSLTELARMAELTEKHDKKIFIAFNTLVKQSDIIPAGRLIARLAKDVKPHALIIQEAGIIPLAKQAGFKGELYLSTLANVTDQAGLKVAKEIGADRVIVPRELSLKEIELLDKACPEGLTLEVFTHGALCYCVSGRCYWSSYMGGKSSLRGRCVQPCRRVYEQGKRKEAFFSCSDLSLDVLTKGLLDMPNVAAWKLEGRKKGPHYVYHVAKAYKLLRDNPDDASARKEAQKLLDMALGRATTKAPFVTQKNSPEKNPVGGYGGQSASGRLVGKVQVDKEGKASFKSYMALQAKDLLRIGKEDDRWHKVFPLNKAITKGGELSLPFGPKQRPKPNTPIFLIDRRGKELEAELRKWKEAFDALPQKTNKDVPFKANFPKTVPTKRLPDMRVRASIPYGRETRRARSSLSALWISQKSVKEVSKTVTGQMSWWLPPVIWPEEEAGVRRMIKELLHKGAKYFVCNAPWQIGFFENRERLSLFAGPFCNCANSFSLQVLADLGFSAAVVSPELPKSDLLHLPKVSPLPLALVISGFWPVGIARHKPHLLQTNKAFASPKGEAFWYRQYGQNSWIYPAWPLDLTEHYQELRDAGYSFFVNLEERSPAEMQSKARPGLFNWEGHLL